MPITKSAIKKMRVDKKRAMVNEPIVGRVKSTFKAAHAKLSKDSVRAFYSAVDRAVKKHLMPARTADRLKSRLVRLSKTKSTKSIFS